MNAGSLDRLFPMANKVFFWPVAICLISVLAGCKSKPAHVGFGTPLEEARKFLDSGGNPDALITDKYVLETKGMPTVEVRCTRLQRAARLGDLSAANLLIERGANPNFSEGEGPPLALAINRPGIRHFATTWPDSSSAPVQMVDLLLSHGADPNVALTDRSTPLHEAAIRSPFAFQIADLLIAKGAKVDPPDRFGRTPLWWAAIGQDDRVVDLLIQKGANPNTADFRRETPLHAAAGNYFAWTKPILTSFLNAGANVNAKDKSDMTPLHHAAQNGNIEAAKLLLAHGADLNARTGEGKTAAEMAAANGHTDCAEFLRVWTGNRN
jgi:ankyrin repeat protein